MASTRAKAKVGPTAADAVEELREALAGADITLPSLAVDLGSIYDVGLVDLGRVNPQTALNLAAAVRCEGR
ncbi:hypothetical protein [Streptomyces sp. NPDC048248]|uniref:hypothetical protein n=1 Tax=Streptomyces sp. NPDC048248 TaxID=3365523 RepID=UPI0037197186